MREVLPDFLFKIYQYAGTSIAATIALLAFGAFLLYVFVPFNGPKQRVMQIYNTLSQFTATSWFLISIAILFYLIYACFEVYPILKAKLSGKSAYLICNTVKQNTSGIAMSRGERIIYYPNKIQESAPEGVKDERTGKYFNKLWLVKTKPREYLGGNSSLFACDKIIYPEKGRLYT